MLEQFDPRPNGRGLLQRSAFCSQTSKALIPTAHIGSIATRKWAQVST